MINPRNKIQRKSIKLNEEISQKIWKKPYSSNKTAQEFKHLI